MSYKKIEILSLIPARGNSKTIKNKNLVKIKKKTLTEIAIKASLKSKFIDKTFLSTDNKKISKFAIKYGIKLINRPKKFSSDNSTADEVVKHFITTLPTEVKKKNPIIIYLQPTSPLRRSHHIDESILKLKNNVNSNIISFKKINSSILKAFININRKVHPIFKNFINLNRQSLPKVIMPNGAIYIFRLKTFLKENTFPKKNIIPYMMNEKSSLDIDNPNDLKKIKKYEKI